MTGDPFDAMPHALVQLANDSDGSGNTYVAKVSGPFPNREAAHAVAKRLRAYTDVEVEVLRMEPPLDEDVLPPGSGTPAVGFTPHVIPDAAAAAREAAARRFTLDADPGPAPDPSQDEVGVAVPKQMIRALRTALHQNNTPAIIEAALAISEVG